MSRQQFSETLAWATVSGAAVANTTTETIIFPNLTIPANYLQDGRTLRLTVIGQYSTTGTPTLVISTRLGGVGGTLICKSGAITTASGAAAALFWYQVLMTMRTNGSSGTIMGNGFAICGAATAGTAGSATAVPGFSAVTNGGVITPATATLDFTADQSLSNTATWSAASSSNTLTGLNYVLESLN